jgi:hypothetical protein
VTEPTVGQMPVRPPRAWRPMAGWTLGILLALGLAWFVGAVVVPFQRAREALGLLRTSPPGETVTLPITTASARDRYGKVIQHLGGPDRAVRPMAVYIRAPRRCADMRLAAVYTLHYCGRQADPVLKGLLGDNDPHVRIAAARGLALRSGQTEVSLAQLSQVIDEAQKQLGKVP